MDGLNIIETTSSFVLTETDQAVHLTSAPSNQVEIISAAQQDPPGPQGPSGYGVTYTHDQSTASSTWIINHNVKRFPSITIEDSIGRIVRGDIKYLDNNSIQITFNGAFSGKAYLN